MAPQGRGSSACHSPSVSTPVATILSASSGRGRCSVNASSVGDPRRYPCRDIEVLVDAKRKPIKLVNQEICFKPTAPSDMVPLRVAASVSPSKAVMACRSKLKSPKSLDLICSRFTCASVMVAGDCSTTKLRTSEFLFAGGARRVPAEGCGDDRPNLLNNARA